MWSWIFDRALSFLRRNDIQERQLELLREKFRALSRTEIGRRLGVKPYSRIEDLPITDYDFYKPFFENPSPSAFLYPLEEYVRVRTSGSTGEPKWFLTPKPAMEYSWRKAGMAMVLLFTHDGDRIRFTPGDTFYINAAPAPFSAGASHSMGSRMMKLVVNIVPDPDMPFHEKVRYFLENHNRIDVAAMPVSTLLTEIAPRVQKPLNLKGFITQDSRLAYHYRDQIHEITGCHPSTIYISTESLSPSLPSVQHPTCFLFDWRVAYVEFRPLRVKGSEYEAGDPIPMWEVRAGELYQPVFTHFKTEVTRYAMPDVLECVSRGDDVIGTELPVFRFVSRMDSLISLHNFTRISEEELITALKNAGIEYVEFMTQVASVEGKEHLMVYVEPAGDPMDKDEASKRLHEELLKIDPDYRTLHECFNYNPIRIRFLKPRTFQRFFEKLGGMPRVKRVNPTEKAIKTLLSVM